MAAITEDICGAVTAHLRTLTTISDEDAFRAGLAPVVEKSLEAMVNTLAAEFAVQSVRHIKTLTTVGNETVLARDLKTAIAPVLEKHLLAPAPAKRPMSRAGKRTWHEADARGYDLTRGLKGALSARGKTLSTFQACFRDVPRGRYETFDSLRTALIDSFALDPEAVPASVEGSILSIADALTPAGGKKSARLTRRELEMRHVTPFRPRSYVIEGSLADTLRRRGYKPTPTNLLYDGVPPGTYVGWSALRSALAGAFDRSTGATCNLQGMLWVAERLVT